MTFLFGTAYAQIDGTRFQYQNCVPSCASELISLGSVDRLKVPAWKIRNESGDTSGGIEYSLAAATVNRITDVRLVSYRFADWADVKEQLGRRSMALIIDCAKTVKTPYRTNSFTGLHSVTAAGGTVRDGTVKVEDPGTTTAGWLRWPVDLLRRASDLDGFHFALLGPYTEDVDRTVRLPKVAVHRRPSNDSAVVKVLHEGDSVHVKRTLKGGPWRRDNGTEAHGWHEIGAGFLRGEALA